MKRKKQFFVWILAAMLLFTQLFVYAAEPKDAKEKDRQEEIIQTEKQGRKNWRKRKKKNKQKRRMLHLQKKIENRKKNRIFH